jgi:hypothetical protein
VPWIDLISAYLQLTTKVPSPEIFRKWAAISMVAGGVERRVWTKITPKKLYPSLYVLLVAPPGVGKGESIAPVIDMLRDTKKIKVAPSTVNSASLFDALANARKSLIHSPTELEEYHTLFVGAAEFGVFFPAYDNAFLNTINEIFDTMRQISTQRIWRGAEELIIPNPQLNILGGTTPSFLSDFLPENAWSSGFCSRFLMIYANSGPSVNFFEFDTRDAVLEEKIVSQLCHLESMYGHMKWEPDAARELVRWYKGDSKTKPCDPAPTHSKLEHYLKRRPVFLAKLTVVFALSRSGDYVITLKDLDLAKDFLFEAESLMPDIFRDMAGKSDNAVIQELHFWVQRIYGNQPTHQRKGVPAALIYKFLRERLPSEKVEKVLEIAIKSDVLASGGPDGSYIPRPNLDLWRRE